MTIVNMTQKMVVMVKVEKAGADVSLRELTLTIPEQSVEWVLFSGFVFFHIHILDPEEGGYMFLRNVCLLSADYTALYPRTYNSS
jgi:hypothetical protein